MYPKARLNIRKNGVDVAVLDVGADGKIFTKSQVIDYRFRDNELSEYNVLEFFTDTYEEPVTRRERLARLEKESTDTLHSNRGRPKNGRFPYQSNHPKHGMVQRVMRSFGHNNLPNIIGRFFLRRDDQETYSFYCASMLMLLKPWRNIEDDLKSPTQTWESAFDEFMVHAPRRYRNILSGIQYFHECESSAKAKRS